MQFFTRIVPPEPPPKTIALVWGAVRSIPLYGHKRCGYCGLPVGEFEAHLLECGERTRALAAVINPADYADSSAPEDAGPYHDFRPPKQSNA